MSRASNPLRRSTLRYGVALLALACGLYFSIAFGDRGWLVPHPVFATPDLAEGDYDLQALGILNRALLQVKDNYVEPERIDPERMLAYALNAIQEEVPQVVAHFDADLDDQPNEVVLQVDRATETFAIGGVGSLWEMSFRLREIFRFVQDNLDDEDIDLRLVEYAAINGMLDTLDPHSVLLRPEVFADMQANNRGSFGGLGIVISIRDGQLTIISPIDDTPAHRAGLRSGDQILKIGEESTINMNIEEAVSRLRGDPGTSVDIEVMRSGWSVPHEFTIVREIISIQSVKSEVLGDGIGYIDISNFQANTHDDLVQHLQRLRDEMGGINGLVLDLRDNPGGLLEQAIRVADTFLDDGTIVTTVGEGHRLREEKKATEEGTEPSYPIIVLVNPGSASASEIVAGALQNHGRAVIVGDRTFGKGSVQVLYEFQDGSALKLTIAQYLTPGDISIQSVGIIPDIGLVPMTVTDDEVDMFPNERIVREGDLDSHLDSDRAQDLRTPDTIIRFYREPEPELDPSEIVPPDQFESDFEIEFAQRLLLATGTTWRADELLAAVTGTLDEISQEEQSEAGRHLAALGVEWEAGEATEFALFEATFRTDRAGNSVAAGETVALTLEVTNTGSSPLYRLRAVSESDYGLFDNREFVFGRVEPGATRSWTVPVEVPVEEVSRYDQVNFAFRTDRRELDPIETAQLTVVGRERPHFGFGYQIVDDEAGNGDGLLQLHEGVTFRLSVTNVGGGAAEETLVYVKNQVEAAILLEHGRETWEDGLAAGATRTAEFRFQVQHVPDDGVVRLEAAVYDTVFREFTSQELTIALQPDGELFTEGPSLAAVTASTAVRAGASENTPAIATSEAGTTLSVLGTLGDWTRVGWADGHFGWVQSASLSAPATGAVPGVPRAEVSFSPPVVDIHQPAEWTDASTYRLEGVVGDDDLVDDYYIWVSSPGEEGGRIKVVYAHADEARHAFAHDVPLFPGANRISVVARDGERMTASDLVYIYRRTPGDALSNAP